MKPREPSTAMCAAVAFLAVAFLAAGARAQKSDVIPKKALLLAANGEDTWTLNGSTSSRNLQPPECVTRTVNFGVPGRGVPSVYEEGLYPGGTFQVSFVPSSNGSIPGYPNNTPSFNVSFLLYGIVGKSGKFLGSQLPLPLGTLGLPNTNLKCALGLEWIIGLMTPMTYRKGILPSFGNLGSISTVPLSGAPPVIPNVPAAGGVQLYVQAISDDNGLIYPSSSLWIKTGTGSAVPGSVIYRKNDNPTSPSQAASFLRVGTMTSMRLMIN